MSHHKSKEEKQKEKEFKELKKRIKEEEEKAAKLDETAQMYIPKGSYVHELLKKEGPLTEKEKQLLLIEQEQLLKKIDAKITRKGAVALTGIGMVGSGMALSETGAGIPLAFGGCALTVVGINSVNGTLKKGHSTYNRIQLYNEITGKLHENGYDPEEDKLNKLLNEKISKMRKKGINVDEYLNKDVSEYNDDDEELGDK